MARNLTSGLASAIAATVVRPAFFFYGDFPSGAVRLWSGYGDITGPESQTYQGVGEFGGVDSVQETADVRANGLTFTLSGIPSDLIVLALGDAYQGRPCKLWLGAFNASNALIADPYPIFSGRMDVMSIADGANDATIALTGESRLVDLERPRTQRYTHEGQQSRYAGDLFCEFVAGLQEKEIPWGAPSSTRAAAAGSSGGGSSVIRTEGFE